MEKRLKESGDLLRKVFYALRDAIFILDARAGAILDCNPAATRVFGYSREEILGRSPDFLHADDEARAEFREQAAAAVPKEGFLFLPRSRMRRRSGRIFPAEHLVAPVSDDASGVIGWVSVVRDVSDVVAAEAEIRKSREQLHQAQKMEALGALVAGVAHELNNPNNLILFNVSLLQSIWRDLVPVLAEQAGTDPARRYGGLTADYLKDRLDQLLSDVADAAERMAKIVGNLKRFSAKSDLAEKEAMDISAAARNVARMARSTMGKSGVRLRVEETPDLPPMRGNPQIVEQILLNLVINGFQAIEGEAGDVVIETGLADAGNRLFIRVSDTGKGVDPEVADRIFDPFVTTRQAVGGTGLGLSVAYNQATDHGGEIVFSDRPGGGAVFTVFFPVDAARAAPRVMVVDDEPAIRGMVAEYLSTRRGCEVAVAENGIEACIKLGEFRPDLIILDIRMQGMDGIELCRALKRDPELAGIEIIVLTGFADDPGVTALTALGVTRILAKPVGMRELADAVGALLARPAEGTGDGIPAG